MIKLHEIHKVYMQGKIGFHALKDVSLFFEPGESVAVHGKSGCGKTTLLNLIAGLDQPTSGEMVIDDKLTSRFKESEWDYFRNHNIGFIFQHFNLIEHLPVVENVAIAAKVAGYGHKKSILMAMDMLDKVGLKTHAKKLPNQLSGGERQRVGIARALINDPDIILADEPTGNLDKKTGHAIMDLIQDVGKGKLIIFVTHDSDLADHYATRKIELRDGKVVRDTNPKDKKVTISLNREKHGRSLSFLEGIRLAFFNIRSRFTRSLLVSIGLAVGIVGLMLVSALFTTIRSSIEEEGRALRENPVLNIMSPFEEDASPEDYIDEVNDRHPYFSDLSFTPNHDFTVLKNETAGQELVSPVSIDYFFATPEDEDTLEVYDNFIGDGRFPRNNGEFVLPLSMAERLFSPDAQLTPEEMWDIVEGNSYELGVQFQYTPADSDFEAYGCVAIEDLEDAEDIPEGFFDDFDNSHDLDSHMEALSPYREHLIQGRDGETVLTYFCDDYDSIPWRIDQSAPKETEVLTLVGIIDAGGGHGALFDDELLKGIDHQPQYKGGTVEESPEDRVRLVGHLDDEHIDEKTSIIRDMENDGYRVRERTDAGFNLFGGLTSLFTYIVQFIFSAIVGVAVVTAGLMLLMILYISIIERTREIGLIRAIGGTRRDVRRIFTGETAMVGILAGMISIIATLLLVLAFNVVFPEQVRNFLADYFPAVPEGPLFTVNIQMMLYALIGSMAIAIISGLIPSVIAGRKRPIEALRNE